jgi:ABC-2 type transport system permease protein
MKAQLRSELLKQRTTQTNAGLALGLVVLMLFVVLFHGLFLPTNRLTSHRNQLTFYGWGTALGVLFAALLGTISVTGEIRHGTMRPTFVAAPRRGRVIVAKVAAGVLAGIVFGLVAEAIAAGAGSVALGARGVHVTLGSGDFVLLLAGGALASGLWAAIGVGVGAILRSQPISLVGVCAWILIVETLLLADAPSVGRFTPGAAAGALAGATAQGSSRLLAPGLGLLLLAGYAAIAVTAGSFLTVRRDVA